MELRLLRFRNRPIINRFRLTYLVAATFCVLASTGVPIPGASTPAGPWRSDLLRQPPAFELNRGLADSSVRYILRTGAQLVALEERGFSVYLAGGPSGSTPVRFRFEGTLPGARLVGESTAEGVTNVLAGADGGTWQTGIPRFNSVLYQGLLPGAEIRFRTGSRSVAFDFLMKAGADPKAARLRVEGARRLTLRADGALEVESLSGRFSLLKPTVFQEEKGKRTDVPGEFVLLSENRVGFRLGEYDRAAPLVIDPTLDFSTQFGGGSYEYVKAIAVDASGIYLAGTTRSWDFPVLNPVHGFNSGGTANRTDAFVTKLTPDGRSLVYSTYLGGSDTDEGLAMAVGSGGEVWVAGKTRSENFPTQAPFQGALKTAGKEDGFLAKLRSDGRALLFSTYLGGDETDDIRAIALDGQNNLFATGMTRSANFPLVGAWQSTYVDASNAWTEGNAFVCKFPAAGGAPAFSTYLGGDDGEIGWAIDVDANGAVIVAGQTWSLDFPLVAALQDRKGDGGRVSPDAFIAKFPSNGAAPLFSTYLGGSFTDAIYALTVDTQGNIYVTGETASTNFPVKNAFQAKYTGPYTDAFLAKVPSNGSSLTFSTYLGGDTTDETARAIAVDGQGGVYVAGDLTLVSNYEDEGSLRMHRKGSFPLADPLQSNMAGTSIGADSAARFIATDGFISRFNASGDRLTFSTYLGGSSADYFRSVALSSNFAYLYVAGDTQSTDFPSTGPPDLQGPAPEGFVARIATAPGPGGMLGPPGGADWTRFILVDTNGNQKPDSGDERLYSSRDGSRAQFASPIWPKASQAGTVELSNPHPVTGKFQTFTSEYRSIAGSDASASAAPQSGPSPATFNKGENLLRIVGSVAGYDADLRPERFSVIIDRISSTGEEDHYSGILSALDVNEDGVFDKGHVDSDSISITSMGPLVQLGAGLLNLFPSAMSLDVPFQRFDVNGDAKDDYIGIDWTNVSSTLAALGFFGDFTRRVFIPLGDTNGDGIADSLAADFNSDGVPDADLPVGAPLAGPAHPLIEHSLYFAQFGDGVVTGAQIQSQIILYNLDSSSVAAARINFRDGQGRSMTVPIGGSNVAGETIRNIPAGGLISLRTDGGASLKIGSVTVASDRPLAGVILFDGTIGVCGVGSSAANDGGFVTPIERATSSGVNTGIAVMNLANAATDLVAELLDEQGRTLARSSLQLAALGQRALYVNEFDWDTPVNLADFSGLLRVSSSGRLAATALHSRSDEIATLPVAPNYVPYVMNPALAIPAVPESRLQRSKRLAFAQFGDGAGGGYTLQSQILLANLDPNRTASVRLQIRQGNGTPFTVDLNGQTVNGTSDFTVSPGGLSVLRTDGLGTLSAGSVVVDSDQLLAGVILFGGTTGLAGVGAVGELPNGFLAPIETEAARQVGSGIAVTNLQDQPVDLTLRLLSQTGQESARASVRLDPQGHRALFVNELTWSRPVNFSSFLGLLEVTTNGPISGTVLRTQPGRLATMPVTPIGN